MKFYEDSKWKWYEKTEQKDDKEIDIGTIANKIQEATLFGAFVPSPSLRSVLYHGYCRANRIYTLNL